MPILARETEIYPSDLLERATDEFPQAHQWWALYTRSRREKQLMRRLLECEIAFYTPIVPRRLRSPGGRIRTSYLPLFGNYVFVFGDEAHRYTAVATGCVSRCIPVPNSQQLATDLRQIYDLIQVGEPLTPEARIMPGERVRVVSGTFLGFEGTVIRRQKETRLFVAVNFMQQGASVLLDDCQLQQLD